MPKNLRNTLLNIILVLLIVTIFYIMKPVFISLCAAILVAFLLWPLNSLLKRYLKPGIASALSLALLFIIAAIPLFFIIKSSASQAVILYENLVGKCPQGICIKGLDEIIAGYVGYIPIKDVSLYLVSILKEFLVTLPNFFFHIILSIVLSYYLLKDGDGIFDKGIKLLGLKNPAKIKDKIRDTLSGLLFGNLIIAFIQSLLATVMFFILGIDSWLLLGFLVFILSLIPYLGAWLVWLPTSVFLMLYGLNDGSWWKGVVLIIYGIIAVSSIDNFLGPKIIGKKSGIHPIFVLIGVIGGIAAFGLFGFILGPFILSVAYSIIEIEVT